MNNLVYEETLSNHLQADNVGKPSAGALAR